MKSLFTIAVIGFGGYWLLNHFKKSDSHLIKPNPLPDMSDDERMSHMKDEYGHPYTDQFKPKIDLNNPSVQADIKKKEQNFYDMLDGTAHPTSINIQPVINGPHWLSSVASAIQNATTAKPYDASNQHIGIPIIGLGSVF